MTITKTVEVPASRRVTFEVPSQIPTGSTARVALMWSAAKMSDEDAMRLFRKFTGSIDRDFDCEKEKDEYLDEKHGYPS